MALRNGQGQRKKYLTLELSSVSNLVEDMCAIVSEFQSAKIGGQCRCEANFAEKDACGLRKETSVTRMLIDGRLSNFSYKRLLR